jgi:hypothetical protein
MAMQETQSARSVVTRGGPDDLQTQLEALLDQVWASEAHWRFWDRLDAFCANQADHCGVESAMLKRSKGTGR